MSAPIAYHITWHTYASWISGDDRGWVQAGSTGIRKPDAGLKDEIEGRLAGDPVALNDEQRENVEQTVRDHCRFRGWPLHAVNPRTTHVHVVVTAERRPDDVMNQLKSWCSRRLNEAAGKKVHWWSAHGSTKWVNDNDYFARVVHYVTECQ